MRLCHAGGRRRHGRREPIQCRVFSGLRGIRFEIPSRYHHFQRLLTRSAHFDLVERAVDRELLLAHPLLQKLIQQYALTGLLYYRESPRQFGPIEPGRSNSGSEPSALQRTFARTNFPPSGRSNPNLLQRRIGQKG
jgi:hypothetical protein